MAAEQSADYCRDDSGVDMVDTSQIVDSSFLEQMKRVGVKTVARYYDYENETIPNKRLREKELPVLRDYGFKLLVVFQHNNNKVSTFQNWRTRGPEDAKRCLELADRFMQPEGSAIYFGVDGDFFGDIPGYPVTQLSEEIKSYFGAVNEEFSKSTTRYEVGVYGGGACINALLDLNLVKYQWLSHSHGFVGSSQAHGSGNFDIEQYLPGDCGGRSVDFNKFNDASADVGDFTPQT